MGYSEKDYMVRVDIFKPSGQWSATIAVNMRDYYDIPLIHDAVRSATRLQIARNTGQPERFDLLLNQGYFFVCLEPYHKHSHPIVIKGK